MNLYNAKILTQNVMVKMLESENRKLHKLKKQLEISNIEIKDLNDSGFFAEFKMNDEKEKYKLFDKTFQIGDVSVDDNDDYHDNLGFLLFVKEGYLEFLDVYFMNLPIDYDVSNIKLVYDQNPRIINF